VIEKIEKDKQELDDLFKDLTIENE